MTIRLHRMSHKDIVLARPFEHVIALIIALTALAGLFAGDPFAGLVDDRLGLAWSGLGLTASITAVLGMHYRKDHIVGRAIEQVGWWATAALTIGGPVILAVFALSELGSAAPSLLDDILLGFGAGLRACFLRRESSAERKLHDKVVKANAGDLW